MINIKKMNGWELLEQLKDQVDMILTSPPYDNQRKITFPDEDAEKMIISAYNALKDGGYYGLGGS